MADIVLLVIAAVYVYLLLFKMDKLPIIMVSATILTFVLVLGWGLLKSEAGPWILGAVAAFVVYKLSQEKR